MCDAGYQRELTYRHKDGSYSAFGESDGDGSIWLTAFVVKSFAEARPFIYIDQKDLQKSIKWITSIQLENGCFPQASFWIHLLSFVHSSCFTDLRSECVKYNFTYKSVMIL